MPKIKKNNNRYSKNRRLYRKMRQESWRISQVNNSSSQTEQPPPSNPLPLTDQPPPSNPLPLTDQPPSNPTLTDQPPLPRSIQPPTYEVATAGKHYCRRKHLHDNMSSAIDCNTYIYSKYRKNQITWEELNSAWYGNMSGVNRR
ncbi:unnamed protein product [Rhizophagus irregularis]|nr:unnamed protein product [Rhizophagus irregularis]CAB5377558.1 unnamed protein product [Rhizophagus irregularis]